MFLDNTQDVKKFASEKALQRIAELEKPEGELIFYPDGRIYRNDELLAEEPSYEQKCWFVHKMKAPARCWETCTPHKPWILRWQYFILEDYQ